MSAQASLGVAALLASMLAPGLVLQLGRPYSVILSGPVLVSTSLLLGLCAQLFGVSVALFLGIPKLWGFSVACVAPIIFCFRRLRTDWGVLRALGFRVALWFVVLSSMVLFIVALGRPISVGPDFIGNSIAMRGLEGSTDVNDLQELIDRQAIFIAKSQDLILPWLDEPAISRREVVYSLPRNADQYAAEFLLGGMRLGLTGWGASLSNLARAAGLSVFGLLFIAELVALLGALGLGYSLFRTRFGVVASMSATGGAFGGIPAAWGWLQSGGSAFVGSLLVAILLLGLVLGGIGWFLRVPSLVLLSALGVTYPDLWLFPLAVLAVVVLLRWLRPSTVSHCDRVSPRGIEVLRGGSLLIPAALIQPAFILGRLEDASVGGWSFGEGSSVYAILGLDARWGALAAADERPGAVGLLPVAVFLALGLTMAIVCCFAHSVTRRAAAALFVLSLSGAFLFSSTNDYLHSKFLSYFAAPILMLISLITVSALRWWSDRSTSSFLVVGLWHSISSIVFLVAMIGQSEVRMPSRIPDLNPEIKDRLWVLASTSTTSGYEIQAFLSGDGALGIVDKNDHCRPGMSVISVVVKSEERLERSELPIEYLQPLNYWEQKLSNRCVAFVEDDYP